MKPLLSYYGGKQRLAPTIISLMPQFKSYIEPFCGGASVFFALPECKKRIEVLNDKDDRIVTFYRVAKTKPDALMEAIIGTPYSRTCHRKANSIWKNPSSHSEIDIAWAVYVTMMQSFSSCAGTGWSFSCNHKKHAIRFYNRKLDLPERVSRLETVQIECDDALSIIARYDSPSTFFYIDPPYPTFSQGHYEGYPLSEYEKLIDCLSSLKGRFILSNYVQNVALPSSWIVTPVETICRVNPKKNGVTPRTELLIMNYQNFDSFFDNL